MFEAINPKATLVALNYNFANVAEFTGKLKAKNLLEKYSLKQTEQAIQIKSTTPPPLPILNDIRSFLPLTFVSSDTTVKVIYTQQELKLVIDKQTINEDNFQNYKKLSYDFLDLKVSDINAIGMNYSAEFNLKENKLLLLNEATIQAVENFDQNISFEFILPLEDKTKGVLSTYRVRKISQNTDTDHMYEISVNFHFDLSDMSTANKAIKLEEIIAIDFYQAFMKQCQKFLEVNNAEKK